MAATPATEAARRRATLSSDVIAREAVEAATHELRGDRITALGCRYPRPASLATTHDSLKTIGVDVRSTTRLLSRIRHRRQLPRAKPLEHRDPHRLLWAKVTLRGYLRGRRWWWGTVPAPAPLALPLTPFSPCRRPVGTFHGGNIMRRNRSPGRWERRGPKSLASSVQVRRARGNRSGLVVGAARAWVSIRPTPSF
jgi:hypothetical protein